VSLDANVVVRRDPFLLSASLSVKRNETVAVVGPNGAGKSTLLGAIAGLLPLTEGSIHLEGHPLHTRPPERRGIGLVFQEGLLFPHLSAVDNVAFGLSCRGMRRGEARQRARRWLDALGVGERAPARPAQLSGGEARRVALARALAVEPQVLLLDEPLASLDARSRSETRAALVEHMTAFGGPRLIVTHDPVDALTLADRMVILENGKVVQEGPAIEVAARPRSAYVAEFVGLNLYRARAEGETLTTDYGATLVAAGDARGRVFAVVHPRAVALHLEHPEGSPRNVWEATVSEVEVQTERTRVRTEGSLPIVAEVTAESAAGLGLRRGLRVWLSVKATEVQTYPA